MEWSACAAGALSKVAYERNLRNGGTDISVEISHPSPTASRGRAYPPLPVFLPKWRFDSAVVGPRTTF